MTEHEELIKAQLGGSSCIQLTFATLYPFGIPGGIYASKGKGWGGRCGTGSPYIRKRFFSPWKDMLYKSKDEQPEQIYLQEEDQREFGLDNFH